jgi:enoyl-CoA hydratase
MGESGTLDTRFLKLGIHPGGGHTWMLRNLVGPQTAAALVLFGDVARGADAVRLGLAYASFPDDELLAGARAFAARAATSDRELAIAIKKTMRDMAAVDTLADAVTKELSVQAWSLDRPAFREGLATAQKQIKGS